MRVIIGGKQVNLNERDVLGAGGEATVMHWRGKAVKLYHQPGAARATKLEAFWRQGFKLPPVVHPPLEAVYDLSGTTLLGFSMALLPAGLAALANFSHRQYRAASGVTLCQVAQIFEQLHLTLCQIHAAGLVVGDLNDQNVFIGGVTSHFIDVDSYQFGRFACPVATEAFLDPALYGLDLASAPAFAPTHDWYSFAVLLFKSLLGVHPYGGTHPQLKTLVSRASAGLPVFGVGVTYPKIALPPQMLSEELLWYFEQVFAQGKREVFPERLLQAYQADLTGCKTCGAQYPGSRRVCPLCLASGLAKMPPAHLDAGVTAEVLLTTRGEIMTWTMLTGELLAIAREENQAVLYRVKVNAVNRVVLGQWISGAQWSFWGNYSVMTLPDDTEITAFDTAGNNCKELFRTSSGQYNGQAAFAAVGKYFYRIAGGMLLRGELVRAQLIEQPLSSVLDGQTWLQPAGGERIVGVSRVFRLWDWFLIEGNRRLELNPELLAIDEALRGWQIFALADEQNFWLARFTSRNGHDYRRLDEFNRQGFRQQARLDAISSEEAESWQGAVIAKGIALIPASNQLLRQRLATGEQSVLKAGNQLEAGTRLKLVEGNLLAQTGNQLFKLRIT